VAKIGFAWIRRVSINMLCLVYVCWAWVVMSETNGDAEDELIRAAREELERVVVRELCGAVCAESEADAESERERRMRVMMGVLVASVRAQRLYFVVRSTFMGLMSALITFVVVWYLGTIGVAQAVFLGVFVFVVSLVVSRLFDRQIVKVSKKIVNFLDKRRRLRAFVLKNL
jgi:Flp pilus assembly protein TadB